MWSTLRARFKIFNPAVSIIEAVLNEEDLELRSYFEVDMNAGVDSQCAKMLCCRVLDEKRNFGELPAQRRREHVLMELPQLVGVASLWLITASIDKTAVVEFMNQLRCSDCQ